MRVSQVGKTGDGYLKYSKLLPTVPEVIASKVYSFSDKHWEKFFSALKELYQNPTLKPLLDIIAVQMVKEDDVAIIYGATLPVSTNGCYTSNKGPALEKLAKLTPQEQTLVLKMLEIIGVGIACDPLGGMKKLEFQAHQPYNKLLGTISHEFGHAVADIVFNNNMLGFLTAAQKAIYEKCVDAFALKLAQLIDPVLDSTIYASVTGKQLLNFEFNRLIYASSNDSNKGTKEDASQLLELCRSLIFSTDAYKNSDDKDGEIFARIFEAFASSKDFPITFKLLGEFSPYFDQVLNPCIDAFMRSNQDIANALHIKLHAGFYGIPQLTQGFDLNEELYFAVMNDNTLEAKELILSGANPSHIMAGFLKTINVAFKRGNFELCKFMLENSKNLDLESVDATGKTTIEIAKTIGGEAHDLVKGFEIVTDAAPLPAEELANVLHDDIPPQAELPT